MRRFHPPTYLALAVLLCAAAGASATETIHLDDGRVLQGEVIRRDGVVTVISAAGLFQFPAHQVSDTPFAKEDTTMTDLLPIVEVQTNHGVMKFELFEDAAPNTVANFIHIAESGSYDGTLFHRVIPGFVIQVGDPKTKQDNPATWGSGGPGWRIKCEIGPKRHDRGVLSMAHAGKDTGGSQFFVVLSKSSTQHLDGKHTVFGRVIEGMDVVDKIAAVKCGPGDRPLEKCVMQKITVLQKRTHPYTPIKER